MNYFLKIQKWFLTLSNKQKIGIATALFFIILGTLLVSWLIISPPYAVLFNQLDAPDANQIISQLEQQQIDYQLNNGGQEILINKNLITKTRLKLMNSNMQLSGSVGFELFDKNDFGMTDFSQKINYQRALQGELERTIASLDEVRKARVHLMIPETHVFEKIQHKPKAAVSLHLKQNLSLKQVQSIQKLIASSVANLELNHVIVVDQNGNTLSKSEQNPSYNHLATKKSIEQYLNEKVLQMLRQIFTADKVMVKIDVSLNYDELQRELVKPQSHGLITHEKEIKNSTSSASEKNKHNQLVTLEKSYQLGSEKELYKRANGSIDHLSISVLVPKNTDKPTKLKIQRLVQGIVGFNPKRGDTISIEGLITRKIPTNARITPVFITPKNNNTMKNTTPLVLIILFAGTAATLTIRKIRHRKRELLLLKLTQWLANHD